jgi:mRNA-degrading endonuclease toxin of MazEF toxin-antitoxin module
VSFRRHELRRGRIAWAEVRDRNDVAKTRPVIILTPTAQIDDEPLIVMAITTTFGDPPPEDHILLPWHPAGRVSTGLRRRSAAVISWITEVAGDDLTELAGDVPTRIMTEILQRIDV